MLEPILEVDQEFLKLKKIGEKFNLLKYYFINKKILNLNVVAKDG